VAQTEMIRAFQILVWVLALSTSAIAGEAPVQSASSLTSIKIASKDWFQTIRGLPSVTVQIIQQTDHGKISAHFTGALLWDVIGHDSWAKGQGKNAQIRYSVIVTGKDGYAAAISEGEIDPKLEGKHVILAVSRDGVALDAPRLVVPGDAHAARDVRDVASIIVR
jgi:hypothetical protein